MGNCLYIYRKFNLFIFSCQEILLLGRIVDKWDSLIKILMSNSYESITISKLHDEVQNLPLQQLRNLFSKQDLNLEVVISLISDTN